MNGKEAVALKLCSMLESPAEFSKIPTSRSSLMLIKSNIEGGTQASVICKSPNVSLMC